MSSQAPSACAAGETKGSTETTFDPRFRPVSYKVALNPASKEKLGIRLKDDTTGPKVILVKRGSPAERAALLPGSWVVSVAGQSVSQLPYADVVRLIQLSPRPLELTLERPASEHDFLVSTWSDAARGCLVATLAVLLGEQHYWSHEYKSERLAVFAGLVGVSEHGYQAHLPLIESGQIESADRPLILAAFTQQIPPDLQERCQYIITLLARVTILDGFYDARSRILLTRLSCELGFAPFWFQKEEAKLAERMREELSLLAAEGQLKESVDDVRQQAQSSSTWRQVRRGIFVGGMTVLAGGAIALTAGLAAPAVAGGVLAVGGAVGLGGAAVGIGAFLSSTAGVAVFASVFGGVGAGLAGFKTNKRLREVSDFGFHQLSITGDVCVEKETTEVGSDDGGEGAEKIGAGMAEASGREPAPPTPVISSAMTTTICASGWLQKSDGDSTAGEWTDSLTEACQAPGLVSARDEIFVLNWERLELKQLGDALKNFATREAVQAGASELAKQTVLRGLMAAVAWPATILKGTQLIDNSWGVACSRADKAGKLLAEVLVSGVAGRRPVTLIGYSAGARVIFECLKHLDELSRAEGADTETLRGIVENAIIISAPVSSSPDAWQGPRRVVAGKLINVSDVSDWLLTFLFRGNDLSLGCAGLHEIKLAGVTNVKVKSGHLKIKQNLADLLKKCLVH